MESDYNTGSAIKRFLLVQIFQGTTLNKYFQQGMLQMVWKDPEWIICENMINRNPNCIVDDGIMIDDEILQHLFIEFVLMKVDNL